MATNLELQSPDFDLIEKEGGVATRDAIKIIWAALNFEMSKRRQGVREAKEKIAPKVLSDNPGANQNNYDLEGASILLLTGSVNRTFTGLRAPSDGESRVVMVHNVGSATYTLSHNSGSSDAANRFRMQAAADASLATDRSIIFLYLNSLWRELKLL